MTTSKKILIIAIFSLVITLLVFIKFKKVTGNPDAEVSAPTEASQPEAA